MMLCAAWQGAQDSAPQPGSDGSKNMHGSCTPVLPIFLGAHALGKPIESLLLCAALFAALDVADEPHVHVRVISVSSTTPVGQLMTMTTLQCQPREAANTTPPVKMARSHNRCNSTRFCQVCGRFEALGDGSLAESHQPLAVHLPERRIVLANASCCAATPV